MLNTAVRSGLARVRVEAALGRPGPGAALARPRPGTALGRLWALGRLRPGTALGRLRSRQGQTMAEYVMLVGFIAIVVLAAGLFLGSAISALFTPVINAFL